MKIIKRIYYPVALVGIFILLISILSFNPLDSSYFTDTPNEIKVNILGGFGAAISSYLYLWFGNAFYFIILFAISLYIFSFPPKYRILTYGQLIGEAILIFAFTILLSVFNSGSGGIIGGGLSGIIEAGLGRVGIFFVLFFMTIISISLIIRFKLFSISTYKTIFTQSKALIEKIKAKIEKKDIQNDSPANSTNNISEEIQQNETPNDNSLKSKKSLFDGVFSESILENENISADKINKKEKLIQLEETPIITNTKSSQNITKSALEEEALLKTKDSKEKTSNEKNFDPYNVFSKTSTTTTEEKKEKLLYDFNFLSSLSENIKLENEKDFNFIEKIVSNNTNSDDAKKVSEFYEKNFSEIKTVNDNNNKEEKSQNVSVNKTIEEIKDINGTFTKDNQVKGDDAVDNNDEYYEEEDYLKDIEENQIISNYKDEVIEDKPDEKISIKENVKDDVKKIDNSVTNNQDIKKENKQNSSSDIKSDKELLSDILFEESFADDEESYSNHPDLKEHFKHLRVSRFKEDDHSSETAYLIDKLESVLREFKIEAKVTGISRGPVITRFEVEPAPGIMLSRIVRLSDNISLSLGGVKIRIIAPIPGKSAVGIEVPNKTRSMMRLGDIFISDDFKFSDCHLPIVLGKDISGKIKIYDLVHMPHLLIAGSTNSGKSVCVNSIICSLLYAKKIEEVKFILVDPKIVELKIYNDIPNLLTPVITEPKKAAQALKWLVKEMENRYRLLESYKSRNILNYNRKIKKLKQHNLTTDEPLDYIILIIDEFADLMMVARKEVEESVARLAAMARAVGIHLILATQRPSTDVITGIIKANFPARIAFMVASYYDSKTILDAPGAEKLLGKGDMLYSTPGIGNPVRIQGTFVSEEEIIKVVDNLKTIGKPKYNESIFEDDEDEENTDDAYDYSTEPLWEDAVNIVSTEKKASASYLQRRLKIGYNRAARIIEMMEKEGIIGPEQGSKPREVLI